MGKIHVLPVAVQNKIAAGEVIERPASVVKELAENAIDAGATHVAVDLEEGGHRLIRVSDNGGGMDEDDLIASMERHATSKIADVDDIFRISSFGFRGEALPSIGAVSRLSVATCLPDASQGHELVMEGGRILRVAPAPPRRGTRVEVRDIFFNTPARRKFLRAPVSETTRASDVLTRLALGNPEVGFRLQAGDRIRLAYQPVKTRLERVTQLFGEKMTGALMPFSSDIAPGLRVDGWFARPPASRQNTRDVYILVNRRWIRFYGLAKAASDAFMGVLPPRHYPFAVIYLTVDPARVDVNAHPAKEEVRFEGENVVIGGVKNAIRTALADMASLPTVAGFSSDRPRPDKAAGPERTAGPEAARPMDDGAAAGESQASLDLPSSLSRSRPGSLSGLDLGAARERLRGKKGTGTAGNAPAPTPVARAAAPGNETIPGAGAEPAPQSLGPTGTHRILGQAGGKYILVDGPDGLLLVDPHALHERWNFDRLVESRSRGGTASRLLLPLDMHLSPSEAAAAVEAVPALAEYGFEFAMPAPDRMTVTAAPDFIPPARVENLIRHILADAGEAADTVEAARERVLASLACRSSVLLGKSLPEEEMLSLLDRFFHKGQLPTCPHGRPTAIRISWGELDRRFGR